jgi:hypothetical protein
MVIVKNGLKGKNALKKSAFGFMLVQKGTANPFFPGAGTYVTAMGTSVGHLQTAIDDPFGTTATIKEKVKDFGIKERAFVAYVQGVINDVSDEVALEMLSTLGLEAKIVTRVHIGDLTAKQAAEAQSISVRKKAEKKRVTYRTQICTDPSIEANWKDASFSSRATTIIRNLISSTKYYLRVAIIRGNVQEDWSDYISIIVD